LPGLVLGIVASALGVALLATSRFLATAPEPATAVAGIIAIFLGLILIGLSAGTSIGILAGTLMGVALLGVVVLQGVIR
jgi:hypothetical protein